MRIKTTLILSFLFLINLDSVFAVDNIDYSTDIYDEEEVRLYSPREEVDRQGRKRILYKFKKDCRKELFDYLARLFNRHYLHFNRANAERMLIPPGYDKEDPTGTMEKIKRETRFRLSASKTVKPYEYVPNFTEYKNYVFYPILNETRNCFNRFLHR